VAVPAVQGITKTQFTPFGKIKIADTLTYKAKDQGYYPLVTDTLSFLVQSPHANHILPWPLFLWKSALNPLPCHLCFLPCLSTIICPFSSTSMYTGGGPLGSATSISAGSLFSPPLSRSLAAAAACAHPSLWLRPSQSLEEHKQVLACNAAIRAALAASCWAKRAALASLRSRRAVKIFWILVVGQLGYLCSEEIHVKLP